MSSGHTAVLTVFISGAGLSVAGVRTCGDYICSVGTLLYSPSLFQEQGSP